MAQSVVSREGQKRQAMSASNCIPLINLLLLILREPSVQQFSHLSFVFVCSIHDIDAAQLANSQLGSQIAEKEQISHERNDARQTIAPLIDQRHLECTQLGYFPYFSLVDSVKV